MLNELEALLTEDPFLTWSEVSGDGSCQDFVLAKEDVTVLPRSVAAKQEKDRLGKFAAAVPPAVTFDSSGALLCSPFAFSPDFCQYALFKYYFYTVCIYSI